MDWRRNAICREEADPELVLLLMADDRDELSRKLAEINRRSSQGSGR